MTTTTITRGLAPDDQRHGSVAGWCAGCRDNCCRTAAYDFKKKRRRLQAYGRWNPWTDAQPVREHIQMLGSYGMGWKRVAEVAGIPHGTVANLLYPTSHTRRPSSKCRPATADAILAVKPDLNNLRDHATVNATGTVRRLRALVALGHTMQNLSERLELHPEVAGRIVRHAKLVSVFVARRTIAVYDELSTVRPEGWLADRTRRAAARKRWAPPLAWDEGAIDDPNAEPVLDAEPASDPNAYDPITVALAVDGRLTYDQLAAHRPDLVEVVRRLAQNLGDIEIAHHLRWPGANDGGAGRTRGQNSVCQFRKRNGITGPEKYEAVYAYTTRDRDRARRRAANQAAKAA